MANVEIVEVTPDYCEAVYRGITCIFRRVQGPRGGKGNLRMTCKYAERGINTFLGKHAFGEIHKAVLQATIQATQEAKTAPRIRRQIGLARRRKDG
jgi:hypothetical protein|tara:strand:+ start:92455 stop:92742 length:288 start_codon:yes stop_codon:yes gene_type:complete